MQNQMSNRLDKAREAELEPQRVDYAVQQITALGYTIDERDAKKIKFTFKGQTITLYPYSGWFTGRTVQDGRGLMNLLNQIKP